jgi:hypothetical protein
MHPFRSIAMRLPRITTLAALLLGLAPLAACAGGEHLVDLQVLDVDRGELLSPVGHRGRDYIAGEPGHRFSVALHNRSGERVLAVLSVDGVNAISGQTAGASQAGYVLEPWQRVEIRGWRKNYSDIAEFYFTDLPDSYAARTGRPDNVGVIGVAAFRERRPPPVAYTPPVAIPAPSSPYPPYAARERDQAAAAGAERRQAKAVGSAAADASAGNYARAESAAPPVVTQQLGTGHGARRYDPVGQTAFERESSRPNQRIALFYDSWEALAARGIFGPRRYPAQPEPFPIGFTPDP